MSELSDIIEASLSFAEPSLEEMEEGKPWYYTRKGQVNLLVSLLNVHRCIEKKIPYISSAAIQSPNGRTVSLPRPARHHDVIKWMNDNDVPHKMGNQGFIDNLGRFVDREEAYKIAQKADQILDLNDVRPPDLYSEYLW
jgi:hypothetical protein